MITILNLIVTYLITFSEKVIVRYWIAILMKIIVMQLKVITANFADN